MYYFIDLYFPFLCGKEEESFRWFTQVHLK